MKSVFLSLFTALGTFIVVSCASSGSYVGSGGFGSPNMGGPSVEERQASIASEPKGNFFYGRRYYVEKTRFWGYLRKPGQSAKNAKLVIINESSKRTPDRLPENGPAGRRYGFDQNYEYRLYGHYTGEQVYEVNSNQFLPEFKLTRYEVVNKNPGWLFSPNDHYNPQSITLIPR
ncbi:hypothetical protein [Oceaniferula marina]|nr:hypothetical protein [Oceaniferula marina]